MTKIQLTDTRDIGLESRREPKTTRWQPTCYATLRGRTAMLQTLHKLVLTGLGAVDLTEEKLRGIFDDLIKRGELTEERVHRLLERRGVAKKEDLGALEDRVRALEHNATAWEKVDPEC